MADTPHQRLEHVRQELRLSQRQLAEALEMTQGAISGMEKGRRPIRRIVLLAMAYRYRVRPEWVASGELPMFESEDPEDAANRDCRAMLRAMLPEQRQTWLKIGALLLETPANGPTVPPGGVERRQGERRSLGRRAADRRR